MKQRHINIIRRLAAVYSRNGKTNTRYLADLVADKLFPQYRDMDRESLEYLIATIIYSSGVVDTVHVDQ
jgi:hypothetical protein